MTKTIHLQDPYLAKVESLRFTITEENFNALGMDKRNFLRPVIRWMLKPVTSHFACIAERYVRESQELGVAASALKTLPDFSMTAESRGELNIPEKGPVLLASNHPGALDSLALTSRMPRSDVKIMVSDSDFMREFAGTSPFFIYVDFKAIGGMVALRDAIEHLMNNGLVIVYAHSEVEPDPELDPVGAMDNIAGWSNSLEIMLRKVPETLLQQGVMSGAVARKFLNSPLAKLRKKPFERQKAAEFIQVIQQLIAPKTVHINVHLSFAKPYHPSPVKGMMDEIKATQKKLLQDHLAWIGK